MYCDALVPKLLLSVCSIELEQGVPVTRDGLSTELQNERQQELLTDSCISQSRHVEVGRELERWIPDENDPSCPDLENIFDNPWKRLGNHIFSQSF